MDIRIYADISNLYYCGNNKYNRKLNYNKLVSYIKGLGTIVMQRAYGAHMGDEAHGFITALEARGWETRFKSPKTYDDGHGGIKRKADWDVGITVDMLGEAKPGETVILCSADGDMVPALDVLVAAGVRVGVIGFNLSADLRRYELSVEIPPSWLLEDGR